MTILRLLWSLSRGAAYCIRETGRKLFSTSKAIDSALDEFFKDNPPSAGKSK